MKLVLRSNGTSRTWAILPVSGYSMVFQSLDLTCPIQLVPKFSSSALFSSFSFLFISVSFSLTQTFKGKIVILIAQKSDYLNVWVVFQCTTWFQNKLINAPIFQIILSEINLHRLKFLVSA